MALANVTPQPDSCLSLAGGCRQRAMLPGRSRAWSPGHGHLFILGGLGLHRTSFMADEPQVWVSPQASPPCSGARLEEERSTEDLSTWPWLSARTWPWLSALTCHARRCPAPSVHPWD